MLQGLDAVIEKIKKIDRYGATRYMLGATQNVPVAVLIINQIMDSIRDNGGAYELHGGIGASGDVSIGGLIGAQIGADVRA